MSTFLTETTTPLQDGIKYDTDKNRLDLLPTLALEEVGRVYSIGARKYTDRNWEKGLKFSRIFGALLRHLFAWWRGEKYAQDDGQHHLASVVWCGLTLLHYDLLKQYQKFDDRPRYEE